MDIAKGEANGKHGREMEPGSVLRGVYPEPETRSPEP